MQTSAQCLLHLDRRTYRVGPLIIAPFIISHDLCDMLSIHRLLNLQVQAKIALELSTAS